MNDPTDFKLPSRSPMDARVVAKQATRLWPFALLLVIAAVSWFLLRPDTIPDETLVKPVIESIDEALEVFADSEIDANLDVQLNFTGIAAIADQRKQSPVIELDELPALDRSDRQFFESLKGMASAPDWLAWLPTDELVRKLVTIVDRAVDGGIERSFLSLPSVEDSMEVIESDEQFSLLESNYGRYGFYVSIIDKLDAESVASIYKRFEPLFESAYSELGYSNRTFRTALDRALRQASISPPPVRNPKLKKMGDRFQYVDLSIEGLPAIQKLYLRIGPENARILRNKVAEIQLALPKSGF